MGGSENKLPHAFPWELLALTFMKAHTWLISGRQASRQAGRQAGVTF